MAEYQSWSGDHGNGIISPGGFEFGVTGWIWPAPIPSSVTFYLDNTASVFDQFGRPIKGVVLPSGKSVRFATTPPKADDTDAVLRKMFAGHAEVVDVLKAEGIDLVAEMNSVGQPCPQCRGEGRTGDRQCVKCQGTGRKRVIACAGWPQLPYDQLKKINHVDWPFDRTHNSRSGQRCGCVHCSIKDPVLRKDALRLKNEVAAAAEKERQGEEEADA